MITFHNRIKEVEEVCLPVSDNPLLNVYGEAGIGKTSLLRESACKLREQSPAPIVIFVNLSSLVEEKSLYAALLGEIVKQSDGRLSGIRKEPGQIAGQIIGQLTTMAHRQPVYLMFDNTEILQENREFWERMHLNLVEPLVIEGAIKQIFVGRIPVPWRRFELRRAVKLLQLGPIDPQAEARNLIRETLENVNPGLEGSELSRAVNMVLEFTFGHPGLSERVAIYIARHWVTASSCTFSQQLCAEEIEPFINEILFENVESLWKKILWLASILDWFDPTILQMYLNNIVPKIIEEHPDYFFIRGLARLRTQKTVVWREERGDRLHGLIRDIVRQCLKIRDPVRCYQACQAAADTFADIAVEFAEEQEYAEQYRQEAALYQERAVSIQKETNHG